MFFFIGGIQPKTVVLNKQPQLCPACGYNQLYLKRIDHYLSLFFIPLFPLKKGNPFLQCDNCQTVFDQNGRRLEVSSQGVLKRCAHCGRTVAPDFSFCPYCGREVQNRTQEAISKCSLVRGQEPVFGLEAVCLFQE